MGSLLAGAPESVNVLVRGTAPGAIFRVWQNLRGIGFGRAAGQYSYPTKTEGVAWPHQKMPGRQSEQ